MLNIGGYGVQMKCGDVAFTTETGQDGKDRMTLLVPDDGDYRHIDVAGPNGDVLAHLHIVVRQDGAVVEIAVDTAGIDEVPPVIKANVLGPVVPMTDHTCIPLSGGPCEHVRTLGRSEADFPDARNAWIEVAKAPVLEATNV